MKMRALKKIKQIKIKPLEKVILRLNFSEDFNLKISKAGFLAEQLNNFFPKEPNLVLLPLLKPGLVIDIPPMGPLRFNDDTQNSIEFGKNYLIFIFNEYYNWDELINKILQILSVLIEILELKHIIEIQLTYKDIFILPKQDFRFKDYFTLSVKIPENWDILPHDMIIGIVPYQKDNIKIILRLRNAKVDSEEDLGFSFETVYINRDTLIDLKDNDLKKVLTYAHDFLEQYFIELLTEEYQNKLGIEIEFD